MPYFTTGENVSDIGEMMVYVDDVTGNFFGIVILFIIFFTVFGITFKVRKPIVSFSFASLVTALTSYFLTAFQILNPTLMTIPTVMFASSLFLLLRDRGSD